MSEGRRRALEMVRERLVKIMFCDDIKMVKWHSERALETMRNSCLGIDMMTNEEKAAFIAMGEALAKENDE